MRLRVPSYYQEFRCIADKCQDSCCIGWEIDIDEDTFEYYKGVEGTFGERLRSRMAKGEENSFLLEKNGWCPFLNEKKLCDICIHLGEEALSEVCTEYPRFTVEYEDVREKALSLSCEEVGRLIFENVEKMTFQEMEIPEFYYEEEREETAADFTAEELEEIREKAIEILQKRDRDITSRIRDYLIYCEKAQQIVNEHPTEKKSAFAYFKARMNQFDALKVLNSEWTEVKKKLNQFFTEENYEVCHQEYREAMKEREWEYEHFMVYFTFRYFMKAYYDGNILAKAQFAVASFLMIRDMDVLRYYEQHKKFDLQDRIDHARIYAKEVEHSEDNLAFLEEAFSLEEVFYIENLIRQI